MGITELKQKLKELHKERNKINNEIQEVLNAIDDYEKRHKDDPYFQKYGIAFGEVHDYLP